MNATFWVPGVAMAILLHGTTLHRAERIKTHGPDPDFIEPGGGTRATEFSTCLESGPFPLGTPEEYARRKAAGFPNEGGPAILAGDVPDDIIALAVDEVYFPLSQGVVQFDEGAGLEELRVVWPTLTVHIRSV
ncbi:MAG TPA: hypothetical protein VKA46_32090 [Gemmataceae bacterium]|nr:hypothetical protein [Gemmataceae bacterium]